MVAPTPCRSRLSCVLLVFARQSSSGVIAECLADDEGAFPRGRELVLAGCSLDQPEHKVALLEGSWLDLAVVVAAQPLLVDGGPAEC